MILKDSKLIHDDPSFPQLSFVFFEATSVKGREIVQFTIVTKEVTKFIRSIGPKNLTVAQFIKRRRNGEKTKHSNLDH